MKKDQTYKKVTKTRVEVEVQEPNVHPHGLQQLE